MSTCFHKCTNIPESAVTSSFTVYISVHFTHKQPSISNPKFITENLKCEPGFCQRYRIIIKTEAVL